MLSLVNPCLNSKCCCKGLRSCSGTTHTQPRPWGKVLFTPPCKLNCGRNLIFWLGKSGLILPQSHWLSLLGIRNNWHWQEKYWIIPTKAPSPPTELKGQWQSVVTGTALQGLPSDNTGELSTRPNQQLITLMPRGAQSSTESSRCARETQTPFRDHHYLASSWNLHDLPSPSSHRSKEWVKSTINGN